MDDIVDVRPIIVFRYENELSRDENVERVPDLQEDRRRPHLLQRVVRRQLVPRHWQSEINL